MHTKRATLTLAQKSSTGPRVKELCGFTNKLVLPLWPSFGTVLAVVAAAPVVVALGASLLTNGAGATLVVALASVTPRITV